MSRLQRSEAAARLLPLLDSLWDKVDGNLFVRHPQTSKARGVLFAGGSCWASNGHWAVRMQVTGAEADLAAEMLDSPRVGLWLDGATGEVTAYSIPTGSDPLAELIGPSQLSGLDYQDMIGGWRDRAIPMVCGDVLQWLREQRGRRALGDDPAMVSFYEDPSTGTIWYRHRRKGRGAQDRMRAVPAWHRRMRQHHAWEEVAQEDASRAQPDTELVMAAGHLFTVRADYLEGLMALFQEYFIVHACFDPSEPFQDPRPVLFKGTAPHRPDIRAVLVQNNFL